MKIQTQLLLNSIRSLRNDIEQLPGINNEEKIDGTNITSNIDMLIQDAELKRVTMRLFTDGHHARAVEEAFKFLNNLIKKKAHLDPSLDGSKLVKYVFSLNSPVLKLNSGISQSEKDEQLGYMEIIAGSITGIRNPRAHEHDWEDTELHALQLLILADHLTDKVRRSYRIERDDQ